MNDTDLIISLAAKYPKVLLVLTIIGALRAVCKPISSIIRNAIKNSPSQTDDRILANIDSSPFVQTVVYLIDWLCSIKLQPVKPNEKTIETPAPRPNGD